MVFALNRYLEGLELAPPSSRESKDAQSSDDMSIYRSVNNGGRAVMADEIPVEDFFRNSEYSALQLSPSGKYMATLAPIHGHRNLVVMETDGLKNPKQLTGISDQDILGYSWLVTT